MLEAVFLSQAMNGKGTLLLCSAENGDLNGLIHALENGDDVEKRDAVSKFFFYDFPFKQDGRHNQQEFVKRYLVGLIEQGKRIHDSQFGDMLFPFMLPHI